MTTTTPNPTTEHETSLLETLTFFAEGRAKLGIPSPEDFAYTDLHDFVRREGRFWTPRPHEFEQRRRRECFNNAIVDAVEHGLRYVEGFAFSANVTGLPVHHAWAADEDGYVVDTTWDPVGVAYLGVEFDPLDAFQARQDGGTIIDDWPNDWPLLREPFQAVTS